MPRSAYGIALDLAMELDNAADFIEQRVADNALATLAVKLRAKASRAREQLREEADRDD